MDYSAQLDRSEEESRYTIQYNRLHLDTLEQKIKEKDQLLLELSSINQEIYQEMSDLQGLLLLSKQERDILLQENISLKDQQLEKSTYISQQESLISKLRVQISELTNGNSYIADDWSASIAKNERFMQELKNLQEKYDSREDLIVSMQYERVNLLNELDRFRGRVGQYEGDGKIGGMDALCRRNHEEDTWKEELCRALGCKGLDGIYSKVLEMQKFMNLCERTLGKLKKYFHLNMNTNLIELDQYVTNLII